MWKLEKLKPNSKHPYVNKEKSLLQVLYEKDVDRVLRSRSLGDVGDVDAEDAMNATMAPLSGDEPAPPGGGD